MAATPSQITYLSPGSMTETASYVIWPEGSNYFCKDGETGQITSSTNASNLITNSLGNYTVLLKHGIYYLDSPIIMTQGDNLIGESMRGTILKGTDPTKSILKSVNEAAIRFIAVKNIGLDGGLYGMEFTLVYESYFENIEITSTADNGVRFEDVCGLSRSEYRCRPAELRPGTEGGYRGT